MDTKLVYGAALLFFTAFSAASDVGISSSLSPVSPAVTVATIASKPKRGVIDVVPKTWTSQGTKLTNPVSISTGISQNVDSYGPQSSGVISNPGSYSPSKNYERTSGNSGYIIQPTTSYSASQSFVNGNDDSYGNSGQPTFGTTSPSFRSNGGQKLALNPLQNHGAIVNQGQNSADYSAFYVPQTKSSNTPNFGYQNAQQSTTGVPRGSSNQGSQHIQNRPISAPYYASFSNSPSPLKFYAEKSPSDIQGQQNSAQKNYPQEQLQPTSYVVSNLGGSYPFQQTAGLNQGFSFIPQQNPIFSATSQNQRNAQKNPNYQKNQGGSSSEYAQMYAPYHQSASSFIPNVQTGGLGPATVDFNGGKIPLPVLQLQSAESFPEFAQALQNQPFVLESNSPYEVQPDFKFLTEFSKNLNLQQPSGNLLPFLNPQQQQQSGQPQVLPVRSANGSPQFPQFKGASLNTYPGSGFNQGVPAGVYEPLTAQPQLHFNRKPVAVPAVPPPTATTASIIHHPSLANTRPLSENRDDVEIIKKKKKPAPPPSHDFDEDDVDDGYKAIEREYGRNQDEDEDDRGGKNYKESDSESDFKPSKSFPFKLYDEKFSKYSKPSSSSSSSSSSSLSSDEDSDDDRPSSRYHHQSSNEDDDDYDGHSSSHHADYRSPKARPSKYEDGEEESQRHERQEEAEGDDEQERKPAAFNSYGADFEQEFEDGYRRELPKNKYVHRKEVPEIDEPSSKSQGRKGYHQSHDEEPAESTGYTSQKYRKVPKNGDSEGYGSHIRNYNKSPRVVHEESYNYKKPDGEGYSKYNKNPSGGSYSTLKKSPKTDSYLQASRSSYKSPKNDKAYEKGDSYSYSTGSSWKSDKKSPENGDHYGHASTAVKTLAQPNSKLFNLTPRAFQGNFVRDLTGI